MSQGAHPFDFAGAREAARDSSGAQRQAEKFLRDSAKTAAVAEEHYRVALAQEIIRQHDAGVAWTVCDDIARGDKRVAELRRLRDIAEGVREAAVQAAWRAAADRRDAQALIRWSMRAAFIGLDDGWADAA